MYSLLTRSYLLYFLYHQFSHFFHQFLIVEDDKDDEDDNDVEDNKTDLLYDSGNIVFNNPGNNAMRLVFSSDIPVQLIRSFGLIQGQKLYGK